MLILLSYLKDEFILFNLFRYITFRAAGASVTAFLICLWLGPKVIAWLKSMKANSFNKREHAASLHALYAHKDSVPTMGGILIIASVVISSLLWTNLSNRFVWILILTMLFFGFLGFWDDYGKLKSKSSKGLSSKAKSLGQIIFGLAMGLYLYLDPDFDKWLYLPFFKKAAIYMGVFFIPFVVLVLTGTSNALNLTDGLDGLAIGCTLFTTASFAVICYLAGRVDFSSYLNMPYIPNAGEVAVFCAALTGASAGFLWFNSYPAEVMMGDTGSLSLGGAIGAVAVLVKKEFVLIIIGGIFVWEALSVIIQVTSFKLRKKRIFLMSPFHHHLQLKGWPESKVTVRLWIIAMILAVVGLSTLKLL